MVDYGVAVALDFEDRGWLVGRLLGEAGEADGEVVLRECDALAGLDQARRFYLGLEAADGDDCAGLEEWNPVWAGVWPGQYCSWI